LVGNEEMTPGFHDQASRGEVIEALKVATSYTSLWAIGTAWSTAIRAIVLQLFPHDDMDVVLAELSAAALTTCLALGVAIVVARPCFRCGVSSCMIPESQDGDVDNPPPLSSLKLQTLPPIRRHLP
jgi:hypothetical protein